jgi:two-component system, chemotaxis family, chemotaxis protein CheY
MAGPHPSANILIIDDSPICRELIRKAVCGGGMTSVEAVDGFDGFAKLGKNKIDAVVLDNEMPKMNGLAFLMTLRSDKRWVHLPVLMLTTTVSKHLIMEATKYGLSGYLLKHRLAVPDLLNRLQQAIANCRQPI